MIATCNLPLGFYELTTLNRYAIMKTKFEAGINIAMKIPKRNYDKTVAFYRDVLQFKVEEQTIDSPTVSRTHRVQFGHNVVWLDCVDNYTRSETWLQLKAPHVQEAVNDLKKKGIETCDEIEELPANMHWILDPAGNVFNVQGTD